MHLLPLIGFLALARSEPLQVDDFACTDHTGVFHRLSRHADARLVVLYVTIDDCPIVAQDSAELGRLMGAFAPRGVRFLGLDPKPEDGRADVARQMAGFGLALPVLMDDTQCVAEMLGVTRAGEALVIDTQSWKLAWRGPLDDRMEYGAQRARPTRAYLGEALEALLAGRPAPADAPAAKGCALTFREPRERHAVDYVHDVAPILARRCVGCHSDGGIGPWSMDGYERVRGWGAMMRSVLLTRRMTPWYADPEHGAFVEDMRVLPEETRAIVHWVEKGAPRGEGEDPLAAPREAAAEWPLGEPDLVVELPEQAIPATGRVPYRKLEVELPIGEDRWVRALDLRPSNPVVLHHAFGFVLGQQERKTLEDELDELPKPVREQAERWLAENGDDPQAALPEEALEFLRRRAFIGRTYFARYFPGTRSAGQREGGKRRLLDEFPAGTGKFLPARARLLFELHYTTTGAPTSDRPQLGIYFHDEPPEHELEVTSAFTRKLRLEPGQRDVHVSVERTFERDFVLYALSPHMHYRGRSMRYTAFPPGGGSEVLLNVNEYVFDWQAHYTLLEPRSFLAGTRIRCDAVYDNSPWNEYNPDPAASVRFGPRSEDEMFVAYMVYAERPAGEARASSGLRGATGPRSGGVPAGDAIAPGAPRSGELDGAPPPIPVTVDDFACLDQHGTFHRLSGHADAELAVLYVYANDCPIVRQQAPELNALEAAFRERVRFLGLDPAPQDERAAVRAQCAELGLALPVLMDPGQCVAEMLGVATTAEALVVSPRTRELLWRGPLDDRLDFGGQRDAAVQSYLRAALTELLAGRRPPAAPPAKGCKVTYLEPRGRHDVEYVRDVAPILLRRCVDCHREGGIGPWKMTGFEKVRGWSEMIREVVLAGRMTPWHADPEHGTFREDIALTPAEARALVHWVERGSPRGEGEDPLALALQPLPEWPLGPPDFVVSLELQELPATGRVPNREPRVRLDLPEGRWVRAVDLRPSNPEVLHHAFAFVPGQQELDTLEDQLPELGPAIRVRAEQWLAEHPGASAEDLPPEAREVLKRRAFQGRTYFAKYFPGQLVDEFPAGTGKFLPADTEMIFELHYTTNGAPATDRPRLGLYFHERPPAKELKVASTWNRKVGMQPHQKRLEVSAERAFDGDITVYSMSPHMHYRGRSMRYTALLPDGGEQVFLNVSNYVFDWQANYTLVEPLRFPAGTRIRCDAVYDNSAQNEQNPDPGAVVRFGPRTEDEMFVGYIVYSRD
jgi:peroxiredoxin